jgi:hypothetical protein
VLAVRGALSLEKKFLNNIVGNFVQDNYTTITSRELT